MSKVIVSYDDTANDRDALALGRLFAEAGATVALAYVRHTHESDLQREALQERHVRELLERGAQSFGDADIEKHVVLSASTGDGLRALALRENADVVVFGSDYRTPTGHVRANTSAQRLLDGGPVAVAIAPAGLHERDAAIERVGVLADEGDPSPAETARSLAGRVGATVSATSDIAPDLLVIGSRVEAQHGRVLLSALSDYAIETARSAVLAVPRGVTVGFADTLVSA